MTDNEGEEGKASLERMGASDLDRASRMGFVKSDAMVQLWVTVLRETRERGVGGLCREDS